MEFDINDMNKMCQEKCFLLLCMHVIRSKPEAYSTCKEYAVSLRREYLLNAESAEASLDEQKRDLLSGLGSVSPSPHPAHLDTPELFSSQDLDDLLDDDDRDDEEASTTPSPEAAASNLDFVNALVHLVTYTSGRTAVSVDTYREMLSQFPGGRDSGLGPSPASASLPYCVMTSDVDAALRKTSADAVSTQALGLVLDSLTAGERADWKEGSAWERSAKAVVGLVECVCEANEHSECRRLCAEHMGRAVERIVMEDRENSGGTQRRRCELFQELAESRYLCVDAIRIVMDLVSLVVENVKAKLLQVEAGNATVLDPHKCTMRQAIETRRNKLETNIMSSTEKGNMFYLYHLLGKLLKQYRRVRAKSKQRRRAESKDKVTESWSNEQRLRVEYGDNVTESWTSKRPSGESRDKVTESWANQQRPRVESRDKVTESWTSESSREKVTDLWMNEVVFQDDTAEVVTAHEGEWCEILEEAASVLMKIEVNFMCVNEECLEEVKRIIADD